MSMTIEVHASADDVAKRAAEYVAACARQTVAESGRFTFAVSGGKTPWNMFQHLANEDVPWQDVVIFQVDERIAPEGDPARNLTGLRESLPDAQVEIVAMPVLSADHDAAAAIYAGMLPERFDLIHLGLGADGHTASLIPNDPVLEVSDRDVAVTEPYQGHQRMTLTYPVLNRAKWVMWLVTGESKVEALRQLRARDHAIPAGRVDAENQLLIADSAVAPGEEVVTEGADRG